MKKAVVTVIGKDSANTARTAAKVENLFNLYIRFLKVGHKHFCIGLIRITVYAVVNIGKGGEAHSEILSRTIAYPSLP